MIRGFEIELTAKTRDGGRDIIVLATTTRFTKDAKEFATDSSLRYRMSLRDFDNLLAWIKTYANKRKGHA
jgi:hypothetical protein